MSRVRKVWSAKRSRMRDGRGAWRYYHPSYGTYWEPYEGGAVLTGARLQPAAEAVVLRHLDRWEAARARTIRAERDALYCRSRPLNPFG